MTRKILFILVALVFCSPMLGLAQMWLQNDPIITNLQNEITTLQGQVGSNQRTLQQEITTLQGQVANLQTQVTNIQLKPGP